MEQLVDLESSLRLKTDDFPFQNYIFEFLETFLDYARKCVLL